ncbi:hypothetical protein [Terribacillus sp. DMT04]|uniref:hypothetical protein n=1 Tax=Terribacillus sp. DMT04 TaxID=2850441 RepID=UPI001C2BA2E7|nr:hypothetical protein [Terribacillus sp. DMT04]QXE03196.1 hypothetical protein KS242_08515 [Terribacillus sp. DMT04]
MKIANFEIDVKDYAVQPDENGNLYITDSTIGAEDFESFLKFYSQHIEGGSFFSTDFFGINFYGRFGQLIFENAGVEYKLRLVLVESSVQFPEKGYLNPVEHVMFSPVIRNMSRKVVEQQHVIYKLTELLVVKEIITEDEAAAITQHKDAEEDSAQIYLKAQVNNLAEHLEETYETIDRIKRDTEEEEGQY